ncbi:EamA family transporter [Pseudomonas sp. PDM14]|uniref:EamA family transporter n=1 Tax=Pseudomonas sp. PDM14 TaxID=2769288 RepID=UPI00177A777D|nr:DMT family transporter [Pseudomonas sp. PDM14]MBD9481473.1 EamA family transporter [Pseudomonas sp. PDM14]
MPTSYLPRGLSVLLLASLACAFAGNHIAARIAFDDGAGLLLAILCRSGVTALALGSLLLWRRELPRWQTGTRRWQLLVGLLIGLQSFCIYSAVMRIPVGLALLLVNLAPILLALLTWALGGAAPTQRAAVLMGLILSGLLLALDVPSVVSGHAPASSHWLEGVLFGLGGATTFATAVWIIENRLSGMDGTVRSLSTMVVVFICAAAVSVSGVMAEGVALPASLDGWLALAVLVTLYGTAFSILFILMPRLDMARNAPVMNAEPVAGLLFGWLILGQQLNTLQLLGGGIVIGGIVLLAYRRQG